MFEPENPRPGDTPVPQELWLTSIVLSLVPVGQWEERPDLYGSPAYPEGLDPGQWQAFGAEYQADVFFDMESETGFLVSSRQYFVVIQRRDMLGGVYLYRWEDLATPAGPVAVKREATWSSLKELYR
jgi:hypothetical protein